MTVNDYGVLILLQYDEILSKFYQKNCVLFHFIYSSLILIGNVCPARVVSPLVCNFAALKGRFLISVFVPAVKGVTGSLRRLNSAV